MLRIGTEWVTPGSGATVHQLCNAVISAPANLPAVDLSHAFRHLGTLRVTRGNHAVTNLKLTGLDLTPYDLVRICEVEVA